MPNNTRNKMHSPESLAQKLVRQWQNPDLRANRLLNSDNWPICLAIGKPSTQQISRNLDQVRAHLQTWRQVNIGRVHFQDINYRATSEAVAIPTHWELRRPSEWIQACSDRKIKTEFGKLAAIIQDTDPLFHNTLIRQRALLSKTSATEIIQACALAMQLEPGHAQGAPLRTLSIVGNDSKFFERHRTLLSILLDLRFAGLVSELGLESFLDALADKDHWLLVADLDGDLLPFTQIRVRSQTLQVQALSANNILLIENERCLHLLPKLDNTIAILGAGLDLQWLQNDWLETKHLAYWGDMDTWGLTMLTHARKYLPKLEALLMNLELFKAHQQNAVSEPSVAQTSPPANLQPIERQFYLHLIAQQRGRLEQEFLPRTVVHEVLLDWHKNANRTSSNVIATSANQ